MAYPNNPPTSNPYPYSTPPPQLTNYTTQPNDSRTTPIVRHLIYALIFSFLIISTVSFIAWLLHDPHLPVFRLNSLSISNFTLHNSQLTANYEIKLFVRNPNRKINLSFESLKVSVFYRRKQLSMALMNPFELGKVSQTVMSAMLKTELGYRVDERTAKDMGRDWSRSRVPFEVEMVVLAKFRAGDWLSKEKSMKILCKNLNVEFLSSKVTGKLKGSGGRDCLTYFL